MPLCLPQDLGEHTTGFQQPGVYALDLVMPNNLAQEWDRRFETRAQWYPELAAADAVVYVGAASNLVSRLEDHRDGDVRQAILPSLADDKTLRDVWVKVSADQAFLHESRIATELRNELPGSVFVRQA